MRILVAALICLLFTGCATRGPQRSIGRTTAGDFVYPYPSGHVEESPAPPHNPGDTGYESWRDFGVSREDQLLLEPIGKYYPSLLPYSDQMLYWTFEANCVTCLEYYGFDEHRPNMRKKDEPGYKPRWNPPYIFSDPMTNDNGNVYRHLIGGEEDMEYANRLVGHGFQAPKPPYNKFIYVRLINEYCGDGVVYFKIGNEWICLGQANLPSYVPVTLKINFGDREPMPGRILDSVIADTDDWHMGKLIIPTKHIVSNGTEVVEYNGSFYTNTTYDTWTTYTTNYLGKVYWAEYHLGPEVFRKEYNAGGDDQYDRIPLDYTDLPNNYVAEFNPTGSNPYLSFIAKPTRYNAEWDRNLKVEWYTILSSTNLLETGWYVERQFKVYGDNMVTVPLTIDPDVKQKFYKVR